MSFEILAVGSALPQKCISNDELAKTVETSDEWIRSRTGITQRYVVGEGESTVSLATDAAKKALEKAGISKDEIGLVVVGTTTPDHSFPAVAAEVQGHLGIEACVAFDVQAACSGFVHGLSVAEALMASQGIDRALVIGADTYSNLVDWSDRTTCVLFGDGAGAAVVKRTEGKTQTKLFNDGRYVDILVSSGGVASTKTAGVVHMNGREVYKHAVRRMAEAVPVFLKEQGVALEEVNWLVPHQANKRILEAVAESLAFPSEKMILTVDRHANTSAASIPLALATEEAKLNKGDLVLLLAFGAGLAWSVALVRW